MAHLVKFDKLKNFVHNVDTSFTRETISTTVEYYPGTGVTYTPASGASKVIYECNYQISWSPDPKGSYPCTRLQYSTDSTNYVNGSWQTFSGTERLEGNFDTVQDYNWHQFFYVLIVDAWSGERKIRLAGRAYGSTSEYEIGRSWNTISSSSEGVGSCPHVTIYSVMP